MAATTRTSTRSARVSPTGRTSSSWRKRSSLSWSCERQLAHLVEEERAAVGLGGEALLVAAGVGEGALAWPNSSDSTSSAGMAPQFTATKGRAARGESSWRARATSSLPVPDSPCKSTVVFTGATLRTCRSTSAMGPSPATMASARYSAASSVRRRRFSRERRSRSSAFCRTSSTSSGLKGLET